MKAKLISAVLVVLFVSAGCIAATIAAPAEAATPSQTSTPVLPKLTSTPTIWWSITSTPLNLPSSNNDEIVSAIDQIAPALCVRKLHNYAILTPAPTGYDLLYPELQFTEVSTIPTPKPSSIHALIINERLDNIDRSFTAFKIFIPYSDENHSFGDSLYIVDNTTEKIFQVLVVGTGNVLYLERLQWIDKDTFFFTEQGHSITIIIAINVKEQRYEYYAYEYEDRCN